MHDVFPAHAGMSPWPPSPFTDSGSFPRPCGDEPKVKGMAAKPVKFSPPARG